MVSPYLERPLRELRDMPESTAKMKAWLRNQPGYWRGRAETRRQMAEQASDGHEQSAHLAAAAEFERRAGV